jgi:hypothetical protein
LHDVDLVVQRRINVDGGIGDEERARIIRNVDDEDMAHTPGRAQLFLFDDCAHEFVGVQAAFHQRLDLAVARQRDGFHGGRFAVLGRHQLVRGEVDFGRARRRAYFMLGPDENRDDELLLGGFDGADKRHGVYGVDDRGADRVQTARLFDQILVVAAYH